MLITLCLLLASASFPMLTDVLFASLAIFWSIKISIASRVAFALALTLALQPCQAAKSSFLAIPTLVSFVISA